MDAHQVARAVGLVTTSTDRLTTALAAQLEIGANDVRALYVVHSRPEVTPKNLGSILAITSGSTTPLVDRLVQRGYLRRRDHPTDRRSSLLELTPAGRHAVAWIADHFDAAVATALADVDDVELIHSTLMRTHQALDEATGSL